MIKNIFTPEVSREVIGRIQRLTPETQPQWGKMDVAQMLAHCSVTYEMIFENKHKKPGGFMRFILKALVKPTVVGEKPYPKNSRTAPAFLMTDPKVFDTEQKRLMDYIQRTQEMGAEAFEGKESNSFGKLTAAEWNVMMYKHLDHHLTQFGV